jgi:hypothetical protein
MKIIARGEEFLIFLSLGVVPSIITIKDNTRRTARWIEERIRLSRIDRAGEASCR